MHPEGSSHWVLVEFVSSSETRWYGDQSLSKVVIISWVANPGGELDEVAFCSGFFVNGCSNLKDFRCFWDDENLKSKRDIEI